MGRRPGRLDMRPGRPALPGGQDPGQLPPHPKHGAALPVMHGFGRRAASSARARSPWRQGPTRLPRLRLYSLAGRLRRRPPGRLPVGLVRRAGIKGPHPCPPAPEAGMPAPPARIPPHKDCGRAPLRTAYSSANLPPGIPTMARQIQYRKRQAPANAQQTRGRRPVRLAAPSVPRGEKRNRASRPPPRTPSDLSIHSAMRQQDVAPRPDSRPSLPGEGETSEGEERTTGAGSEGHFFHRRPMACSMISRATSTASGFGTIFTTTGGLQQVKRLPIVSSKAWVAFSIR